MTKPAFSAFLSLGITLLVTCSLNAQGTAAAPAPPAPTANAPQRPVMASPSGHQTIHNDFFWVDQNGYRIATRSGCLCQFGKEFYWYGGSFPGYDQTCYVSTDLVHWTYKGVVLRTEVEANRMDMLYNDTTKQYVIFLKHNGNSAFFGIATASSVNGTNVTAPKTYENYTNFRWESVPSDPQWMMVDLGAQTEINRVILKWHTDFAKAFKVQVSNDATTWTDVYGTSQGAFYSVTDENFKTTFARYVRMYGTQRGPEPAVQGGYSLFDFMVLKD